GGGVGVAGERRAGGGVGRGLPGRDDDLGDAERARHRARVAGGGDVRVGDDEGRAAEQLVGQLAHPRERRDVDRVAPFAEADGDVAEVERGAPGRLVGDRGRRAAAGLGADIGRAGGSLALAIHSLGLAEERAGGYAGPTPQHRVEAGQEGRRRAGGAHERQVVAKTGRAAAAANDDVALGRRLLQRRGLVPPERRLALVAEDGRDLLAARRLDAPVEIDV